MKQNNTKGFTIIEVVLVLAIASLIFLMVFIALPALQRSQRDSALKSEASKVLSAITSYQSSNKNAWPTASTAFASYVDGTADTGTITLPSGTTIQIGTYNAAGGAVPDYNQIYVTTGATCATNPAIGASDNGQNTLVASVRNAAVVIKTESGSTADFSSFFCQNT